MNLKRRLACQCLVSVLFASFTASPAVADDAAGLRAEVQSLRARLNELEQRLAKQEQVQARPQLLPPTSGEGSGIPSWVRDVNLSGFAAASYVYNTQSPEGRTNSLRVFDTEANGFQPNNFEIALEKPVSEESRVGFRTDLHIGEDAEVTGSVTTGLGSTTDEIDLQQAYAEALLPVGKGLNVKFGKFTVLHGAEVTESKDDWNFSRSYLFGYAQALTHTGVRLSYPWTEWLTTVFGVNQGWDVVDDNNTAKTVEWQAAVTPCPTVSLAVSGMHGPEQAGDNRDDRHLIDVVLGWNPTEKLGFKLNYDFGSEEDAAIEDVENATWHGVAAYARYQFTDWYALALRGEYFADFDGIRTGSRAGSGVTDARLLGLTLTNEFKVYKDLITRLEYRHDHANGRLFSAGSSLDNTQDTISAEVIYPF